MSDSTCWSLIEKGGRGCSAARDAFARRYEPLLRAYLGARWRHANRELAELDDAVQEVFFECFRHEGILERVDAGRPGGFRAFLYGVARNVAFRYERRGSQKHARCATGDFDLDVFPADEEALSRLFDRSWATALLKEAAELQRTRAGVVAGEGATEACRALRRVELLRLRFYDGLAIREIARRWGEEAPRVHKEYARARQEFKEALLEVLALHYGGSLRELEQRAAEMLALFEC